MRRKAKKYDKIYEHRPSYLYIPDSRYKPCIGTPLPRDPKQYLPEY